ncbi:hypothetical protein [Hydrogenophaga sp. RWCD_12]|uniref:hypothetical protein n=1 Tax=Hydrogenophaga sp. RWCD_12 TaxID=3391190 RepID=UPI00398489D0
MYLVVIAWLYVAVMMSAAEATADNGSLLGAIVTFFLYGLLPLSLVVYLMLGPRRRQAIREREAAAQALQLQEPSQTSSGNPDTGGHAASAAETDGVAPVRKEP